MPSCIICFLHKLRRCQQIKHEQQSTSASNLAAELEDLRRFSLNSLMALLAILAISGSKVLQPVALTLLIYTISLRFTVNTCFLAGYPALSRFLHIIPLLGTFCTAGAELVSCVQPPALAAVALLLGVLPLLSIVIHHGKQCAEISTAGLPMQMQDVPVTTLSGSVDSTPTSG